MNLIAEQPFRFHTRQNLTYLLGRSAKNIAGLLAGIKELPLSSIYHHTHHYLDQHEFLSPEPPNDYAYWLTNVLQNDVLGEEIAGIDLRAFSSLQAIQARLIEILEYSVTHDPEASLRVVPAGEDFHFMAAQTFVFPTEYIARDLREFLDCLQKVSNYSIYYHIFEARLHHPPLEFGYWIEHSLRDERLAAAFRRLDPYALTIDNLRKNIMRFIRVRLEGE